jgi:hypothetical protein
MILDMNIVNTIAEEFGVRIDPAQGQLNVLEDEDLGDCIMYSAVHTNDFKIPLKEYNFFKSEKISLQDYLEFINDDMINTLYGGEFEIFHRLVSKICKMTDELQLYLKLNGD